MARPNGTDFRIFVDDVEVGAVEAGPITPAQLDTGIELALTFRANWPGIWHSMALSLDSGDQDLCDTTQTARLCIPCHCDTYDGNLGPCAKFELGGNGRCAYCDHAQSCHP